jgi:hypothetical protein
MDSCSVFRLSDGRLSDPHYVCLASLAFVLVNPFDWLDRGFPGPGHLTRLSMAHSNTEISRAAKKTHFTDPGSMDRAAEAQRAQHLAELKL